MSDAMASLQSLAVNPVPGAASPAGASARHEPSYTDLRSEIDKLSGVSVSEIDWKRVADLSTEILETKSKDLLVASYLCLAAFQTGGFPSLAEGLEMVRRLLETHWEGLFPERSKARAAAVTWLWERVASAVRQSHAGSSDREAIEAAASCAKRIDEFMNEKLAGEAPGSSDLQEALAECAVDDGVQRKAGSSGADGDGATERPASGPAGSGSSATAEDLSTPEGLERAIRSALSALRNAGRRVRANSPQDPLPYKISRLAAWGRVSAPPPNVNGRTQIPPPSGGAQTAQRLETLGSQSQWQPLLEAAESAFETSVFWLDAQRYVATALQQLGEDYERVRRVVISELKDLLARFPALQGLTFSDGKPFASEETVSWISQEVMAGAAESEVAVRGDASAPADGESDKEFSEALDRARSLAGKRKLRQAVGTIWEALDGAGSGRVRFVRRLELARFLVERKELRLAESLLRALDEEMIRHMLEEWDAGLALEALRLHVTCLRALTRAEWKNMPEAFERAEALFSRLARLDPRAAMDLGPR